MATVCFISVRQRGGHHLEMLRICSFLLGLYSQVYFSGFAVETKILDFANIVSGSSVLLANC